MTGRHALTTSPHQLTAATANQRLVGGGRAGGGGRLALQLTSIAASSLNSSEKFIEVQQRGSGGRTTSGGIPCPQIGGSWLLHVQVLLREMVRLLRVMKSIRAHHQVVMWHAIADHHACRAGAAVRTRFGGEATGGQRAGNASLATARAEKDALKRPEKEAPTGAPGQRRPVLAANLLIQQTAGDEDEEALKGVEHRKEIRHDQVGARGEVEDAKGPGEAKDDDQGKGGAHPDAEKKRKVRKFPKNPTKNSPAHIPNGGVAAVLGNGVRGRAGERRGVHLQLRLLLLGHRLLVDGKGGAGGDHATSAASTASTSAVTAHDAHGEGEEEGIGQEDGQRRPQEAPHKVVIRPEPAVI